MVSTVCKDDIELCSFCIEAWKDFLSDPYRTLEYIIRTKRHSDDTPFDIDMNRTVMDSLIWEGQIKLLFPAIERYRSCFVKKHLSSIESVLPIENVFGEIISNPLDVELGLLIQLAGMKKLSLSNSEYEMLDQYRHARNDLAHLSVLDFSRVETILAQNL